MRGFLWRTRPRRAAALGFGFLGGVGLGHIGNSNLVRRQGRASAPDVHRDWRRVRDRNLAPVYGGEYDGSGISDWGIVGGLMVWRLELGHA